MCSEADDVREIQQLWKAAELYYSLLPNLDKSEMEKTVQEWSDECKNSYGFYKTLQFKFSCHIASCAIRLYSIDEKRKYQRYTNYMDWWYGDEKLSKDKLRCSIHCILRNVVAHNEEKGNTERRKERYKELKNYYLGRSFNNLHDEMKRVVKAIAQDLNREINGKKIKVDSFV